MTKLLQLSSGEYVIGGITNSRGVGDNEIALFTLQNSSFAYCGDLLATDNLELVTTKANSISSWGDSSTGLDITLEYIDALSLYNVNVITSDLTGSFVTTDGGVYCDTVGDSSSFQIEATQNNPCECTQFGTCSASGRCSCFAGYAGPLCSYTLEDYNAISSSISASVTEIKNTLGSLTTN